jgi:hypothetical protein
MPKPLSDDLRCRIVEAMRVGKDRWKKLPGALEAVLSMCASCALSGG